LPPRYDLSDLCALFTLKTLLVYDLRMFGGFQELLELLEFFIYDLRTFGVFREILDSFIVFGIDENYTIENMLLYLEVTVVLKCLWLFVQAVTSRSICPSLIHSSLI
jgi:hypothetical protein